MTSAMMEAAFSTTFQIKVNGTAIPDTNLARVCVDESLHVANLFEIRYATGFDLLNPVAIPIAIGATVEISLQDSDPGGAEVMMVGDVTTVEVETTSSSDGFLVVRGLDISHRLTRGKRVRAFVQMTASDIVRQVAREAGLQVEVTSTTEVLEHTTQAGESDWEFLTRLAADHGRLLAHHQGRLRFVEHPSAAEAAAGPMVLEFGTNILSIRSTLTAAGQVERAEVRGWDPKTKKEVVATEICRTDAAAPKQAPAAEAVSRPFRPPAYLRGDPRVSNTATARARAKALADHIGGGFMELEATVQGHKGLRAGVPVKLAGCGNPFDGGYVLTSVRHIFEHGRYATSVVASHGSDRSLLSTASPSERPDARIAGLTPALVTSIADPESRGRVKVRVPWLSDDYESGWARTLHVGAGAQRGLTLLPEVGDEVLVGFAAGDLGHPYVLGGLYNGKDQPKPGWAEHVDGGSGAVARRSWVSRTGMEVAFVERSGAESLEITTNDGSQKVVLQQTTKGIEIVSQGPVSITAQQDATIEAKAGATIKASGKVAVESQASVAVKAPQVEVNATAALKLSGTVVDVVATGPLTLKGALVRIN